MEAVAVALSVMVTTLVVLVLVRWSGAVVGGQALAVPERVPFTGGVPPTVHAWSRFHVRWYSMALLFLAFDMEMVFMYPWAVVFVKEGAKALMEMGMFIVILVLGILYAWREGALEWA
ncbi:MAG: NADH-quinone oxidoreductase subunit A [Acidimicrobiales bacterium]